MFGGLDLFKSRHRLTVLRDVYAVQEHSDHARLVAVHYEFLVAHGEPTLEPARGVQHKVDAGQCGGLQRVGGFIGRLRIGQLGATEAAAAKAANEAAAAKGVRIIPSCGFDSIPSDLGSFFGE